MTKRQYFDKIDFNNLPLKEQVEATFKVIDFNYPTLEDGDDNHLISGGTVGGRSDDILREANIKILKDYPRFELISRKILDTNRYNRIIKNNRKIDRDQWKLESKNALALEVDVSVESICNLLKQEIREENLTNLIS